LRIIKYRGYIYICIIWAIDHPDQLLITHFGRCVKEFCIKTL